MISYRQAKAEDAQLLADIYNSAFYSDYLRYGECPGYGKTKEAMEQSLRDYPKLVILLDDMPVGCISCQRVGDGEYEIGALCVIPEYQGRGIGTAAMNFLKSYYADWKKITLVTPADKVENVRFYTEKCGFSITSFQMEKNVKIARFLLEK